MLDPKRKQVSEQLGMLAQTCFEAGRVEESWRIACMAWKACVVRTGVWTKVLAGLEKHTPRLKQSADLPSFPSQDYLEAVAILDELKDN